MEDMSIDLEGENENQSFTGKKPSDRKPANDDPITFYLMRTYYMVNGYGMGLIRLAAIVVPIILMVLFSMFISNSYSNLIAFFALVVSVLFIFISLWILCWILEKDVGTRAMQEISDPIKEGSEGFFITQYGTIFKLALGSAVGLFIIYLYRSPTTSNSPLHLYISGPFMALITAVSFLIGANCSALSGYAGIWVSVRANVRVAASARKCYNEALQICFRGGAFSAIINVALAIFGISSIYLFLSFVFYLNTPEGVQHPPIEEIAVLLVGFGFGASFVAMFAQLGGGIYTKAADVGADLIGKVEVGIPEDDPRNPAVIADLVGDNVGDCAGQCADLFESISAEIISAMILGGAMAEHAQLDFDTKSGFILFPLIVHSLDLLVSTIAVFFVHTKPGLPFKADYGEIEDPLVVLKRGYYVSLVLALIGLYFICSNFLYIPSIPQASFYFFLCSAVGVVVSLLFIKITQYYTDYKYCKVQSIARSSQMGHATNIITGLSVGLESTGLPIIVISIAIITSYYLGEATGIKDQEGNAVGGLYATAIATMGMFSSGVYVLSMSGFGPIADNAGGIVEMSGQDQRVREITDRLDAVGNVTKANTKGYSVGSASLACFLLFSAYLDEVEMLTGKPFRTIDIAVPEIFVGGLLGSMTVFVFSAWAIIAVGIAAEDVIKEVRRQFKEHPGILTYQEKPNYKQCVSIVNKAGLIQMVKPGVLSVMAPITVGVIFRIIGSYRGRELLGAEVLAGFLMFATSTGILMALFFNNGGGAWDNAKKYIETGMYGGKGSEAHKAAVTGDTVGDPCKDTAGPSIHILIKLLSTITLVLVPLFSGYGTPTPQ